MKFRKVAALSLASVMALSLAACGGNSGGDSKGTDDTETKTEGEKTDGEKTESSSSSGAELSVSIWDTTRNRVSKRFWQISQSRQESRQNSPL